MNLREAILAGHSKTQTSKIVQWVGTSQQRFDALFDLFLQDEYRVVQRASRPVSYCVMQHPPFIKKHFGRLLLNLRKPELHNAVKRNTVRLLQVADIPAKYRGQVMELCFQYIASPTEAVAVKACSLTILHQLSKQYPAIVPEIALIIEERWEHETAAFRVRAKRFIHEAAISKKMKEELSN